MWFKDFNATLNIYSISTQNLKHKTTQTACNRQSGNAFRKSSVFPTRRRPVRTVNCAFSHDLFKPSNLQTLKPSNPQTFKLSNLQTFKLSNFQTFKPSNPQTFKLYLPGTLKNKRFSSQRLIPFNQFTNICSAFHAAYYTLF